MSIRDTKRHSDLLTSSSEVYSLEEELSELESRLAATTNFAADATRNALDGQPQRSPGTLRFVGPECGMQHVHVPDDGIDTY